MGSGSGPTIGTGGRHRLRNLLLVAFVIAVLAAVGVVYLAMPATKEPGTTKELAAKAPLALVSPPSVAQSNGKFIAAARELYDFSYADAANFTTVENLPVVLVATNGTDAYGAIVSRLMNSTEANLTSVSGFTFHFTNAWTKGQDVYVLYGYSAKGLTSALDAFVSQEAAPSLESLSGQHPVNSSDPDYCVSDSSDFTCVSAFMLYTNGGLIPLMPPASSQTAGYFEPHCGFDENLTACKYYDFAQVYAFSDSTNDTVKGSDMPGTADTCDPPSPPPGETSFCYGTYTAVPVIQTTSGTSSILSAQFTDNSCGEVGELGNGVYGLLTVNVPNYGPGPSEVYSCEEGVQTAIPLSFMNEQEALNAGATMFSSPIGSVGGSVMVTGEDSASTGASVFIYGLYSLVSVQSDLPIPVPGISASNFSVLFNAYPISAPAQFTGPDGGTYTFEGWSITETIGQNQTQFFSPYTSLPLYVYGPTTAEALYSETSAPAHVAGFVGYYCSGCLEHEGAPLSGVQVTFTGEDGQGATTTTTNSYGRYLTPDMQPGYYDVSATADGYDLYAVANPMYVNGLGGNLTLTDNIFEYQQPSMGVISGSNMPQSVLPHGGEGIFTIQVEYPDGKPAVGAPVGTVNSTVWVEGDYPESTTTTNIFGQASFVWQASEPPGRYVLSFFSIVNGTLLNANWYWGYDCNLTISASPLSVVVPEGGSSIVALTVGFLPTGYGANLTTGSIASGLGVSFLPSTVQHLQDSGTGNASATIAVSSATPTGTYVIPVYATEFPSSWQFSLKAEVNITVTVVNHSSTLGGVEGTVLDLDSRAHSATILITGNGQKAMTISTATGVFDTGYVMKPGQYNVTVYGIYGTSKYYSTVVTVSAGSLTPVILTDRGALVVTVLYDGAPASGAQVNVTLPYDVNVTITANAVGEATYPGGFLVVPGVYNVTTTYGGATVTESITITPGVVNELTVNLP